MNLPINVISVTTEERQMYAINNVQMVNILMKTIYVEIATIIRKANATISVKKEHFQ